ncbi:hypothetical protein BGZ94_008532, partial [Podila epigama]
KRVEGEDKFKGLPIEAFGMSMSAQSYNMREGSTYRQALLRMGDAHQNMGIAQTDLIARFSNSYIECLTKAQAQMKEYQALQKKLQSRRLDYNAKLAKVQKAKKEKPEWEEEMQSAKAKYEDTRECVLNIMAAIQESQDEDVNSLKQYYEAQLWYARRVVEILESIPESTFIVSPNGSQSSLHRGLEGTRPLHRQVSHETDDARSVYSDDHSSIYSAPVKRAPLGRAPSTVDLRRQNSLPHGHSDLSKSMSHLTSNAMPPLRRNGSMIATSPSSLPPIQQQHQPQHIHQHQHQHHHQHQQPHQHQHQQPPTRSNRKKYVKALYNFDATGEGELSLRKGDVIGIVEEIDEGWWIGELVDADGVRQEGMFPSNYCEEIDPESLPTHLIPTSTSIGQPEPSRYMDEDEVAYYERESEPTIQYSEPEPELELGAVGYNEHGSMTMVAEPIPVAARRVVPPPPVPATRQAHAPLGHRTTLSNGSGILSSSGPSTTGPARGTPPPSRPLSAAASPLHRVPTIGSRAPPPPPPSRRAGAAAVVASTAPDGPGGGPTGPARYLPVTDASVDESKVVRECRECNCSEFTPNVFKRDSCNNCFHIH